MRLFKSNVYQICCTNRRFYNTIYHNLTCCVGKQLQICYNICWLPFRYPVLLMLFISYNNTFTCFAGLLFLLRVCYHFSLLLIVFVLDFWVTVVAYRFAKYSVLLLIILKHGSMGGSIGTPSR